MAKDIDIEQTAKKRPGPRKAAVSKKAEETSAAGQTQQVRSTKPRAKPRASVNGKGNLRSKLKEQKQNFIQGQILEVAAELIAASGFRAVTIDDISATLGFSKSVIYYYLESKNDILWRIFTRIYESYFASLAQIAKTDSDPDTKLYEIVRLHATNVMTHRAWTAISLRDEPELDEKQRRQIARQKREYDATIEEIYRDGVSKGMFIDVPAHIAVAGLLGACNSIHTWYNPEGELSAAEIAAYYADLLANGFRAKKKVP